MKQLTKTIMNNQEERARFRIKHNGKYGFIDKVGNEVIPCQFENAGVFREGLARVKIDGKWGFIDRNDQMVIKSDYLLLDDFHEGMAVTTVNKGYYSHGYICKTGREIVPPQFDFAGSFENGLALVRFFDDHEGYLDETGRLVVEYRR